jgi:hypothetical protein
MKGAFLVATSVLALAVVSKPLVAAESETPAPTERAAPAAEPAPTERAAPAAERAPARERAAPARQGQVARTAPQQSTSSQTTSSYTGTQAGGFGGGNAGGGGFADPTCPIPVAQIPPIQSSSSSQVGLGPCPRQFNQPLGSPTAAAATFDAGWATAIPGTGIVVGGLFGVSVGKTTATTTQNYEYVPNLLVPNLVNAEQITNSVSQSTSETVRFKGGYVVPIQFFGKYTSIMPYFTAGYIHSTLQGTYNYSGSNFNPMTCVAFNPMCATNAYSATSWTRSSNGFIWGFGAEMPLSAFGSFGPGVVLVVDYTRAQFGSFDVNLPFAIASVPGGGACVAAPGVNCAAVDVAHLSNVVSNRLMFGARFKLF